MSAHMDNTIQVQHPSKRPRLSNVNANAHAGNAQPSPAPAPSPLQCQVCHRSYERVDHLNRHLDSHRNERLYRCQECRAGFNRKDLLLRHQAIHAKLAAQGRVGPNRTAQRATKACNACVVSKVRCDNSRPCKRCRKKDLDCTTRVNSRSDSFVAFDPPRQSNANADFITPPQLPTQLTHAQPPQEQIQPNLVIPDGAFDGMPDDTQETISWYPNAGSQHHAMHNFFEQIMVLEPDFPGTECLQSPPNLTSWLPEAEVDWFGDVDIFGSDFAPAIDETFQTPCIDAESAAAGTTPQGTATTTGQENNSGEAVRRRHAVFKQSPWYYIPDRNQNAFTDQGGITLDERQLDLATSPHLPYSSDVTIPGFLSQQARDRIFKLVCKTAHSRISIPSFPSANTLNKLLQVGIAKRTETDAWIHPYTFDRESSRPEFLLALVVAGCICFGIPSVNKTGLVLHEIVRISLQDLSESDNSVLQELQYLQASMLWLDIGAFCGFKQKMRIAESSLQALVTALRRAGRFDSVRYTNIMPTMEDDDEQLHRKWRDWVELESYKRLAYHLFEHDIYMTMVNHRPPLLSYAELSLPLPASRFLWFASSAEIWRTRMLSTRGTLGEIRTSLLSILRNETEMRSLPTVLDTHISRSSFLHSLAAQIWEWSQQSAIHLLSSNNDPTFRLWLLSRQQKLYASLQDADVSLESSKPITLVWKCFLCMCLHVDLDAVTRFAGRCGEEAAHRAYIALQAWSQTKEARTAISHAGMVIYSARHIPPYQNRGQDSLVIYHAIMVLWTYSMVQNDRARKTATATGPHTPTTTQPRRSSLNTSDSVPSNSATITTRIRAEALKIFLDDPHPSNKSAIDIFITSNVGIPHLHIPPTTSNRNPALTSNANTSELAETCNLHIPSQVMKTGVRLLDSTHPDVGREDGPPLLRALCCLMEEIAALDG